jgi:dihydropyrimidine dehydrogenase (NAD+) subunit PreA
MERHDAGTQHLTRKERTCATWVPEPMAAPGKERHKMPPGKARALGIG